MSYFCRMGQKKLHRFEAIKSFSNVLQYPENMPGRWETVFHNHNPVTLELACGKGEYTVGLSAMHPDRNFIGVDLKGNRLYAGAKRCIKAGLGNAAFLRTQIDKIDDYFLPGEVQEIWITFPDPQLRTSRAKKRLTHPRFLALYQKILRPGGMIHLKTDSPPLFRFTLLVAELFSIPVMETSEDLYAEPASLTPEQQIQTHYEQLDIAQSKKIFYCRFQLPEAVISDPGRPFQEMLKGLEPNPEEEKKHRIS